MNDLTPCIICQSDIDTSAEKIVSCKKCVYKYHEDCLLKWFSSAPSAKCFSCLVCQRYIFFQNFQSNLHILKKKLEKYFDYSSFTENIRWAMLYMLYIAIGKITVHFFLVIKYYLILNFKNAINQIINPEHFFNAIFIYIIYPVIPCIYDYLVLKYYMQKFYSHEDFQQIRLIFYECHQLANIILTILFIIYTFFEPTIYSPQ